MATPVNTRTRVVAGAPIEVGARRFLPSILVTTVEAETPTGPLQTAHVRPVSLVEQGPEGNRWHAVPNATQNALSVMAAAGAGFALVMALLVVLVKLSRQS
jgi:hypothetical protein